MSLHRQGSTRIFTAILACASVFAPTVASAAAVPCVQRAINWNSANPANYVVFAIVALHESAEAAHASGSLMNAMCTRAPYAGGTVSCLKTFPGDRIDAQLLHPLWNRPPDFLRLWVDVMPSDNLAQVHLRQPNATYDFDPGCVGNMLVGNDQFNNHWTVAFSLRRNTF